MTAEAEARKPSVLWLTSSYPRYQNDSASVFLRYLAEALAKQNFDIRVLAPDHPDQCSYDSAVSLQHFRYSFNRRKQALAYGSGILPNLRVRPTLIFQVPGFIAAMFFRAAREIVRDKPTLLHAHWIFPQGTLAVVLGKLFKIPVLVTAHGADAFGLTGPGLAAIKRWTVQQASAWTSNTQATAGAVACKHCGAVILPMGIPFDCFAAVSKPIVTDKSHPEKYVVLFIGRLVEKKGVTDLIMACARLPNELHERVELRIIGDGEERQALEMQALRSGISHHVTFLGRIANHELPDHYANADIFVAPSIVDSSGDTEGQGVILLEAMAAGVPVVSTRTGGIGEVIEHAVNGILVEPNCPEQLAEALTTLIQDRQYRQRLSDAGKITASKYDWKAVSETFATVYQKLIPDCKYGCG
ncbi:MULTISPECIES: glycosyltransferase [Methylomonas]|uniref:Glycosyl transferase family 1 n=1 Tax=Methylomonas koyamae TaxID=702114 RepID=A0A177NGG4_9GAMM|nr:glycosyltransferase [Methylomonas koyamae]OAI17186.1 hypothetical protein A1355_08410 [Methylomonas koyamae]